MQSGCRKQDSVERPRSFSDNDVGSPIAHICRQLGRNSFHVKAVTGETNIHTVQRDEMHQHTASRSRSTGMVNSSPTQHANRLQSITRLPRISTIEVVNDGLSGQLQIPVYDHEEVDIDGIPKVPQSDEQQPPSTVQGVPLIQMIEDPVDEDTDSEDSEDDDEELVSSDCRITSILTRIGIGADFASLWRMPLMVHKYGACFLVAYLLLAVLAGLPAFYLELSLGQFCSRGASEGWMFAPMFRGVGRGMVLVSMLISIYLSVVLSWSVLYTFLSMYRRVPWEACNSSRDISNCTDIDYEHVLVDNNITISEISVGSTIPQNSTAAVDNYHMHDTNIAPQAYFWNVVVQRADSHDVASFDNWQLGLCLLSVWSIIGFWFTRRISYRSKIFNGLSSVLLLLLIVFCVCGVSSTQKGAFIGLNHLFFIPWTNMRRSEIWLDAFGQLVLSLGVCAGAATCYGSRQKFRHNIRRDVLLVFGSKLVWSAVSTVTVFIAVGQLSHISGLSVDRVLAHDAGLLFVAVSGAVLLLPEPPAWAALFFLLLATVGLKQLCFWVEPVVRAPLESNPARWRRRRLAVVFSLCLLLMICSLPLITSHGIYAMTALDRCLLTWSPLVLGCAEAVCLCWLYGTDKWTANVDVMLAHKPSTWWRYAWKFLIPACHMMVLLFGLVDFRSPRYDGVSLAWWTLAAAQLVSVTPILLALINILLDISRWQPSSQHSRWNADVSWGPEKERHRWETYGVAFVAPEPILMVHVDSILRPECFGGIPHGYYLLPNVKKPHNKDVLRHQENLRRQLQRRLMDGKRSGSVAAARRVQVVIEPVRQCSDSGSDSNASTPQSSICAGVLDHRRKSVLEQAAILRHHLETGLVSSKPHQAESSRKQSCFLLPTAAYDGGQHRSSTTRSSQVANTEDGGLKQLDAGTLVPRTPSSRSSRITIAEDGRLRQPDAGTLVPRTTDARSCQVTIAVDAGLKQREAETLLPRTPEAQSSHIAITVDAGLEQRVVATLLPRTSAARFSQRLTKGNAPYNGSHISEESAED